MDMMNNFYKRTFYKNWKDSSQNSFHNLELVINGKCDLKCKYCYINKYRDSYFPKDTEDDNKIIDNLYVLKSWMKKENFKNMIITLFGGEIFSQKIGRDIFRILVTDFPMVKRIHIPSNMNFMFNHEKEVTEIVELCLNYGKEINIGASVDGLYMEDNRPFKDSSITRDSRFYDRVFKFHSKYNFDFHPMIYSDNIEKWKDNFKWFQSQFEKYNINPFKLYMLEVRNENWSEKKCIEFSDFIKFLVFWCYNYFEKEKILDNLVGQIKRSMINILATPFMSSRGYSCAIQVLLAIRMGDLKVFPCHRLMYNEFNTCKLNEKKLEFEDSNSCLGISIYGHNGKNLSCKECIISELCSKGCLGAQKEIMGDPFIAIPSVCRLEHYKVLTLLKSYNELGILTDIINGISSKKTDQIKMLKREGYL